MRKILFVTAALFLLLSPALAQNTQPKGATPKKVKILDVGARPPCVWIEWQKLNSKRTYQIRAINAGKGKIEFINLADRNITRSWQNTRDRTIFPPGVRQSKIDRGQWRHYLCGLAPDQQVRIGIRAVNKHGLAGPVNMSRMIDYDGRTGR